MSYEALNRLLQSRVVLEEFGSRVLAEETSPEGAEAEFVSEGRLNEATLMRMRGYFIISATLAGVCGISASGDQVEEELPYPTFLAALLQMTGEAFDWEVELPNILLCVYTVERACGFKPFSIRDLTDDTEDYAREKNLIQQAASYLYDQLTDPQFEHRRVAV